MLRAAALPVTLPKKTSQSVRMDVLNKEDETEQLTALGSPNIPRKRMRGSEQPLLMCADSWSIDRGAQRCRTRLAEIIMSGL